MTKVSCPSGPSGRMNYVSPFGSLLLCSEGDDLTELRFGSPEDRPEPLGADPVLKLAESWLDAYFAGKRPSPFDLPLAPKGTDFQLRVWDLLLGIPYGETVTYGELAKEIARQKGIARMSSQAVGGAVGRNRIGIIIPCHRVIGAGGNLTGFGGGIDLKIRLLEWEGVDLTGFFIPKSKKQP